MPIRWTDVYDDMICAFEGDGISDRLLEQLGVDGWRDGGCHAFAIALQAVLGAGTLCAVGEHRLAHHSVLRIGDRYLDIKGAHTMVELSAQVFELAGRPLDFFPIQNDTFVADTGDERFQRRLRKALSAFLADVDIPDADIPREDVIPVGGGND
jgi:hypothetical protein